ncbi:hypothetical protein J6590_009655 [Homalodisca vitripennis]|nr:hypothetical protein J6590_009655 [Homalodisca vitripennis]
MDHIHVFNGRLELNGSHDVEDIKNKLAYRRRIFVLVDEKLLFAPASFGKARSGTPHLPPLHPGTIYMERDEARGQSDALW